MGQVVADTDVFKNSKGYKKIIRILLMKAITTTIIIVFATVTTLSGIVTPSTRAQQQPTPQRERLVAEKSTVTTAPASTTASIGAWRVVGPIGGDVRTIEADPNDAQRLYLGTLDGQIYTSTDRGQSWKRLETFDHPGIYIDHIIIDPRDSKMIYVGAHKHKEPGGFFKSIDGGQTWRESESFKRQAIHSLAQSPMTPDILIVGTNDGVYRSTDAGEAWSKFDTSAYPDLINVESIAIDPRNDDAIYAGTWHLPWKTTNGGKTWFSIKNGIIDDSDVFSISIDARDPDHVIASACSGIYETKNAGANWRKVQGIPSQSRRTRAILQHPALPGIVFAGTTEGFWRSTNGGSSWMLITTNKLEINSIAVHKENPNTVFIGTNNYGVMVSHDNGKTFSMSNEGFSGRLAFAVQPDREKHGRVYATTINTATGGGFFFISDDTGQNWRPAMRNMPSTLFAKAFLQDAKNGNIIYLGTNLGMYVSYDRGESWAPLAATKVAGRKSKSPRTKKRSTAAPNEALSIEINKQLQAALNAAGFEVGKPDGRMGKRSIAVLKKFQTSKGLPETGKPDAATLDALGIKPPKQMVPAITDAVNALVFTLDERGGKPGILAAVESGLYRSYDPANGWEKINFSKDQDSRTLCVTPDPQNPQGIWVGTAKSGVLSTQDGGETWTVVSSIPRMAPVTAIVRDPKNSSKIYVGTRQTLYISDDKGETFKPRANVLPYGNYASILVNPENTNEVFVGNSYELGGGIFHSTDGGVSWQQVDSNLPSHRVWTMAFDGSGVNRIFVGSHSAGVYVMDRGAANDLNAASAPNK